MRRIRDDSLEDDDPQRYFSFGGEGKVNLFYEWRDNS